VLALGKGVNNLRVKHPSLFWNNTREQEQQVSYNMKIKRGARNLIRYNLKVVLAELPTLSLAILPLRSKGTYRAENSAQF